MTARSEADAFCDEADVESLRDANAELEIRVFELQEEIVDRIGSEAALRAENAVLTTERDQARQERDTALATASRRG